MTNTDPAHRSGEAIADTESPSKWVQSSPRSGKDPRPGGV